MPHKDRIALRHILEAIDSIGHHTEGETKRILSDRKTRDAVVFNLAVIGEAVKSLSGELRSNHGDIPWRRIAGMRDRLIHGYFAINDVLVTEVVARELPGLRSRIAGLLKQYEM